MRLRKRSVGLALWFGFLLLPIYWMLNMSLRTNADILSSFQLVPQSPTLANYAAIFGDPAWYRGYLNSIRYVALNTAISLVVALPAAYAFSRYRFLGDRQLFFWLLTNRMAPPAVFLLHDGLLRPLSRCPEFAHTACRRQACASRPPIGA